jgi:FkbM family methyltransferase
MVLDHLLPAKLAALADPRSFVLRLAHPTLVSFGLLANLAAAKRRGVFAGVDAVIDVGANSGQFAFMASRALPGLPVHAFEPDPEVFAQLEVTCTRFRIDGTRHNVALADAEGTRTFHQQSDRVNSSLLPRTDGPAARTFDVVTRRLDALVPTPIDVRRGLLKIDVQGAELDVLLGATGMLDRVQALLVEVSFVRSYAGGADALTVARWLRDHGFQLFDLLDTLRLDAAQGAGLKEADLLFVRA